MFSGVVYASTGCDTNSNACETGICRDKHCAPNTGPAGPHTRAEFTLNPDWLDLCLFGKFIQRKIVGLMISLS